MSVIFISYFSTALLIYFDLRPNTVTKAKFGVVLHGSPSLWIFANFFGKITVGSSSIAGILSNLKWELNKKGDLLLYNVIINYIFISVGFNEYTFCKQPQTEGRQSYLQGFAKFWIFFLQKIG